MNSGLSPKHVLLPLARGMRAGSGLPLSQGQDRQETTELTAQTCVAGMSKHQCWHIKVGQQATSAVGKRGGPGNTEGVPAQTGWIKEGLEGWCLRTQEGRI